MLPRPSNREILVELITVGAVVKATAFDVATMTEVCIQGPASLPPTALKNAAIKRLEYVLRKKGIV